MIGEPVDMILGRGEPPSLPEGGGGREEGVCEREKEEYKHTHSLRSYSVWFPRCGREASDLTAQAILCFTL